MLETTHDVLSGLVPVTTCKPGWQFWLDDSKTEGLRLVILVPGVDSYAPQNRFNVRHYFPVPIATYNEKTWRRWIFDCCRGVENHELGEWFKINGSRPFPPLHGPGENPYVVQEYRDREEAHILQSGKRMEGDL